MSHRKRVQKRAPPVVLSTRQRFTRRARSLIRSYMRVFAGFLAASLWVQGALVSYPGSLYFFIAGSALAAVAATGAIWK